MPPRRKRLPRFDPGPSGDFAKRVLDEVGVPGALIGRLAVWAWLPDESEHQFTKDLDVAVARQDLALIRQWMQRQGFRVTELTIGGVNFRHPEAGVNVNFIERSRRGDLSALFADAVRAAFETGVTTIIGDADLPLAPAEHLVAMKMATGEPDDEQDAARLLMAAEEIDIGRTRRIVAQFLGPMGANRLEVILRQIGHPAAKPKKDYE